MARLSLILAVCLLSLTAAWAAGGAKNTPLTDAKMIGNVSVIGLSKLPPQPIAFEVKDVQFFEAQCVETTEKVIVCSGWIVPKVKGVGESDITVEIRYISQGAARPELGCGNDVDSTFTTTVYMTTVEPMHFWAINQKFLRANYGKQGSYVVSLSVRRHERVLK